MKMNRKSSQDGFTMIEVMASMLIFAVMTLGITPVLISAVRGATLSRSFTIGKNLAQEAMERVRGLPYAVSVSSQSQKVDVLDLYFPSKTGSGYSAAGPSYTTVCTSTSTASRECPDDLPDGYSITYVASFVDPVAGSGTDPESYSPTAPADGYAWNTLGADLPPTRLLRMAITASWTLGAEAKSFSLSSLVGDRKVASDRVAGTAKLDYVVQVGTSYEDDDDDDPSDLTAQFGEGESRIETRLLSAAEVTSRGSIVELVRPAPDDTSSAQLLASFSGATAIYSAPANVDPGANVDIVTNQTLAHPDLDNALVAGTSDSHASGLRATVADGLPIATGAITFNNNASAFDGWVNTQAAIGSSTFLKLNSSSLSTSTPSKPILHLQKGGGAVLNGNTSAVTAALSAFDRRVQTTATGGFGQLNLFPVTYISQGTNPSDRVVIRISNFTATTDCKSTGSATSSASASYSATLTYWAENDWVAGDPSRQLGNNSNAGGYRTVNLKWDNTSDPLAAINASSPNNPLVYENPLDLTSIGSSLDIYLFPIEHDHGLIQHNHRGYLSSWGSLFDLENNTEVIDDKTATASIPGAISLTTVPLDTDVPSSSINVTIGNLSCTASDFR